MLALRNHGNLSRVYPPLDLSELGSRIPELKDNGRTEIFLVLFVIFFIIEWSIKHFLRFSLNVEIESLTQGQRFCLIKWNRERWMFHQSGVPTYRQNKLPPHWSPHVPATLPLKLPQWHALKSGSVKVWNILLCFMPHKLFTLNETTGMIIRAEW